MYTATLFITGLLVASAGPSEESNVPQNYAEFSIADLHCVIGNNAQKGEHKERYNGLFSIVLKDGSLSSFVPAYAGLNLEHYFDAGARSQEDGVFFEPRCAPMEFVQVDATTAELHQPPTPHYGVESWTHFALKEPHYVDMTFRCVPKKAGLAGNMLGVFWASYINAPADKSIYFLTAGSTLDKPQWVQYCTQVHGRDSTVCAESDNVSIPFAKGDGTLYNSISALRYSAPFFYGRFHDKVLIYIFRPGPCIRFSHSPSGGGPTPAKDDTNPAWDFQLIIPEYQVGKEYGLSMRLVYKPWLDRADVLQEVRKYLAE